MSRMSSWQEASTDSSNQSRLGFIAGVVTKTKCASFERILFRATRGNMYLKQSPWADFVADPASGDQVIFLFTSIEWFSKCVITIFFFGSTCAFTCDSNRLKWSIMDLSRHNDIDNVSLAELRFIYSISTISEHISAFFPVISRVFSVRQSIIKIQHIFSSSGAYAGWKSGVYCFLFGRTSTT